MLLERRPLPGAPVAAGAETPLSVHDALDCARFSLRIAPGQAGEAAGVFGCELPGAIGGMTASQDRLALCLGPDEWLLMAPAGQEEEIRRRFEALYPQVPHSLVDIGHRETGIEVEGPEAALALASGCPLDLSGMAAGSGTRTVFDRAQIVLIKRSETSYRIEVWRSFAPHVRGILDAARHEIALGL